MGVWWVILIYIAGSVVLGWSSLVIWTVRRSPSRAALRHARAWMDAAVRGMEQGRAERAAVGVIGTWNDVPTTSTTCCLVCGEPFSSVGPSHRFKIKDDIRRCWTP